MLKKIFLFLMVIALVFSSCTDLPDVDENDPDTEPEIETPLTGEESESAEEVVKLSFSDLPMPNDRPKFSADENLSSATYRPKTASSSGTKYSGGSVIHLTSSADFTTQVTGADGFVLVDFYRGGCQNCVYSGWAMEQLAKENYAGVKYCNVQVGGTEFNPSDPDADLQWYKDNFALDDPDFMQWMETWLTTQCNTDSRACATEMARATQVLDRNGITVEGDNSYPMIILFKDGKPVGGIQGGQPYYDGEKLQNYMGGWDKIGMRNFIDTCVVSEPEQPEGEWTLIEQDTSVVSAAVTARKIRNIPGKIYVPNWFFGRFDSEYYTNMLVSAPQVAYRRETFYAMPGYIVTGTIQPYQFLWQLAAAEGEFSQEDVYAFIDGNLDDENPLKATIAEYFTNGNGYKPILLYGSSRQTTARWGVSAPTSDADSKMIYYILDASENYVSVYCIKLREDNTVISGTVFEIRKGGKFTENGGYAEDPDAFIGYGDVAVGGLMDWHYMWPYVYLHSTESFRKNIGGNVSKVMTQAEVSALMGN